MNKLRNTILYSALLMLASLPLYSQPKNDDSKGWKDRIMSEKIAFLTTEAKITPEEAQKFWPVYNQIWEERWASRRDVMDSFRKLDTAIKENKSSKEISKLLDIYLSKIDIMNENDKKAAEKFKQILPTEKVAKIYVSEEKFRRQQIHKLHHKDQKENGK